MPAIGHNTRESALLQAEIHKELMRRGTVEPDDQTMAEYVTVLCINEKPIDEIGVELADIGGADFDASFLSWLTGRVEAVKSGVQSFASDAPASSTPAPAPVAQASAPAASRSTGSSSRLLSNALAPLAQDQSRHAPQAGYKRGLSPGADGPYKRRSLGNGHVPSGPKAMRGDDDDDVMMDDDDEQDRDGRRSNGNRGSLLERISGPPRANGLANGSVVDNTRFDRPMRNMRGRGMRPMGGMMNRGFGPGMGGMNPMEMQMQAQMMAMMQNGGMGFGGQGMMDPMAVMMQQQEQLAHMQIMMNQMAEAVNNGGVQQAPVRPPKPTAQPAQKLGDHTIIARPGVKAAPATSKAHEPAPTKPTSPDLCKFGVGCTNVRCPYSHPSPVATIASGVVLRTNPCPNGKECKDADCSYSHVSPAQVHGETSGERRVLCKFPVCTNPACQYRHEDASGNPIPPPALTRSLNKETSREVDMDADHDDWDVQVGETTAASGLSTTPARSESDVKASLDQALGDGKKKAVNHPLNGQIKAPCRFGLACTNKLCKFTHPIDAPCRYGTSCFKEDCPFSHPPGRKTRSIFKNNVTKNKSTHFNPSAPSFTPKPHISERKFVDESKEVTKLEQDGGGPAIDVVAEAAADEVAATADL